VVTICPPGLTFKIKLPFAHAAHFRVLYRYQKLPPRPITSLYKIKWCVFLTLKDCLLRGTRSVFMFQINFVLKQLKHTLISIYLLTAIGLTPGGGSTVHIYTQKIHRTQLTTEQHN
jgi:hypothetical protein